MGGIPAGSGNALMGDVYAKTKMKIHFHNAIFIIIKGLSLDINIIKCTLAEEK